ncbi:conserved hypothetical protein [Vibrio nigripulchritudo MADA3029]|uniref:SnoaL-like domain-containing protein n=2 Tax=Vibrio nigripulchritudo TaxID=28173 RepID=U4KEP3_9VIBR|nr:nuclear transport factor 2 family protein [Vibrio nigripulchritudo]KJY75903.1 polyketide cyclase [Vibrio nigripulchritudo]CCN36201.1 conserved hypothetical protein [Vibrio nigripulchritudo AM115]CCN43533.1 conserved hypothetical protein [Vibrio nigripulchritudo FTn2]CCN49203.1 conserved hypothetical protein [Vibrio nigripulchritudo MADA3020]CCN54188.1 conserved hypothetical protein [Vibrio nigripulchritudo MADA3021]
MKKTSYVTPKQVVANYWKAMAENDFHDVAKRWLSEDFECSWPQSNELIVGQENFASINSEYPAEGKWTFQVNSLIEEGTQVVSDVTVSDGKVVGRAITFHTVFNGRITKQTEFWPDNYPAPEWRKNWVKPLEEIAV